MNSKSLKLIMVVGILFFGAAAPAAWAGVYTWDGGGGNDSWHTATNWTSHAVPPSSWETQVVIDNNPGATAAVKIYNSGYYNMNGLTVTSGDSLTMSAINAVLQFYKNAANNPPFITNDGTITFNTMAHMSPQVATTLSGAGEIVLHKDAYIWIYSNAKLTQEYGHTIRGDGNIEGYNPETPGPSQGYLENYGRVMAANISPSGGALKVWARVMNITDAEGHTGSLSASPGATLELGRFVYRLPYNPNIDEYAVVSGGRVDPNGGVVKLKYGALKNLTVGPGDVWVTADTIHNKLVGAVTLESGTNLAVQGTTLSIEQDGSSPAVITNHGTMTLDGSFGSNYLKFLAPTTLAGTGQLILSRQSATLQLQQDTVTDTLTNDLQHNIRGLGVLNVPITNHGTIIADGNYSATSKILQVNKTLTNSDTGRITATNGGTLLVSQPILGTGSVTADGGKLDIQANLTTKNLTLAGAANTAINVAAGQTVEVSGDFLYGMTDPGKWTWATGPTGSTLKMSGSDTWHFLEVGGRTDLGSPSVNNFALCNLVISGDIALVDWADNQPGFTGQEALYVESLTFAGSTLNLNNLSLYVWDSGLGTFDLVEVGDYGVGHVINQAIPVPPTMLLLGSGLLGLVGWRRFRKN